MALPIDVRQIKVEIKWEELVLPDVNFNVDVKIEKQHDWAIDSANNDYSDSYQELTNLQEHLCRKCGRSFKNRYTLLQHNLKHISVLLPPVYQCQICDKLFINKNTLTIHKNTEHVKDKSVSKSKRKCEICNRVFKYKNWHSHINTVHTNQALQCDICHKKFKCKVYLKRHIKKRHSENPQRPQEQKFLKGIWKCQQCDAKLNSKYALTTHRRNCHSEPVTCDICGTKMKSKSYLRTHLNRIHKSKGHICPVCGKTIRSPSYLKLHLQNHERKTERVVKTRKGGVKRTNRAKDNRNNSNRLQQQAGSEEL